MMIVIGIDGGGTIAKVCIYQSGREEPLTCHTMSMSNNPSQLIQDIVNDRNQNGNAFLVKIVLTGGMAQDWSQKLLTQGWRNDEIYIKDEIQAFILGVKSILAEQIPTTGKQVEKALVVSAGTGASFIDWDWNKGGQRVAGTAIAGGTFMGLGSLITNGQITCYEELTSRATPTTNKIVDQVNLTVGDIYSGKSYGNLDKNIVAGYFTKLNSAKSVVPLLLEGDERLQSEALYSLLKMICYNMAQLTILYADQLHHRNIIVGGGFFKNELVRQLFREAFEYWQKWEKREAPALDLQYLPSSQIQYATARGAVEAIALHQNTHIE